MPNSMKKISNSSASPDDEIIKNLDLLLNYEVLEAEQDWDAIETSDSSSDHNEEGVDENT